MVDLFEGMKPADKKVNKNVGTPVKGQNITISSDVNSYVVSRNDNRIFNLTIKANPETEDTIELKMSVNYTSVYTSEGADWNIYRVLSHSKALIDPLKFNEKIKPDADGSYNLKLEVVPPSGIRYGDRIDIILYAISIKDPAVSNSITLSATARQAFLAVKCSRGHEVEVADALYNKSSSSPNVLFSIFVPSQIRGYFFVEGMSSESVKSLLKDISKARGIVAGSARLDEIEPFLVPQISVTGIVKGDIVELVSGPFKGERGVVKSVDIGKEELTVELLGSLVPIPVTIRGDSVRLFEKEKR